MPFHLQSFLDRLYERSPRQFTFQAQTPDDIRQWQTDLRTALRQHLRIDGRQLPETINATEFYSMERDGYTETKLSLDGGETPILAYVLKPNTPPPYKAIMAFPGHGVGVELILGLQLGTNLESDNDYAPHFARAGYLVCAVEQQGFGERVTDQVAETGAPTSCRHLAFEYLMHDRTLLGERVWDGMLALQYLLQRADVDANSIGCVGHSGGGTTTLFLSALDERIAAAVISCYFCSFKQSILKVKHCACNYVPGLLKLAENGDFAGLIAPRPVRFIAGQKDHIFDIKGVYEQFAVVQGVYAGLNAEEHCSLSVHPQGHAFKFEPSREWFDRWL
jgi:cephalosporin-C deacetylase-like acetyl esterase